MYIYICRFLGERLPGTFGLIHCNRTDSRGSVASISGAPVEEHPHQSTNDP